MKSVEPQSYHVLVSSGSVLYIHIFAEYMPHIIVILFYNRATLIKEREREGEESKKESMREKAGERERERREEKERETKM